MAKTERPAALGALTGRVAFDSISSAEYTRQADPVQYAEPLGLVRFARHIERRHHLTFAVARVAAVELWRGGSGG